MACRQYEDALRELAAEQGGAAAGNSEAERGMHLRAHLATCAACAEALQAEQQLYADMDAALREEVNVVVPGSLAPRIRAAVETETERWRMVSWRAPAFAALAALSVALAVFIALRGRHDGSPPSQTGVHAPAMARQTGVEQAGPSEAPGLSRLSKAARAKQWEASAAEPRTPEVLVPPDERAALEQFISHLQPRQELATAFLNSVPEKEDQVQHLAPLEIARLEVTPIGFEDQD